MYIPTYQIHNVLTLYTKQLSQRKVSESQKSQGQNPATGKIDISPEGKRQVIIDKVAADIVNKIKRLGSQREVDQTIISQLYNELGQDIELKEQRETKFIFNIIDENNQKSQNTLHVEDSDFLIKRLDQMAEEAVKKTWDLSSEDSL